MKDEYSGFFEVLEKTYKKKMKQVTLKVNNISTGQWSTLLLELNLIAKAWKKASNELTSSFKLQASSGSWKWARATSPKRQARALKRTQLCDIGNLERYMLIKEAKKITGGLSKPGKMPEGSYNLPAAACQTGAKLRKIAGTPCHKCYAFKGRYNFSNVQQALQRRLASLDHPQWAEAMTVLS